MQRIEVGGESINLAEMKLGKFFSKQEILISQCKQAKHEF